MSKRPPNRGGRNRAIIEYQAPPFDPPNRGRWERVTDKGFIPERGIDMVKLGETFVAEHVDRMRWRTVVRHPAGYDENMVREFYAYMDPETVSSTFTVVIRGTPVRFSPTELNNYYDTCNRLPSLSEFGLPEDDLFSERRKPALADALREHPYGMWDTHNNKLLHRQLTMEAAFWNLFVAASVSPSNHHTDLPVRRATIVYCILRGRDLDVGKLVASAIIQSGNLKNNLPFPCLITELCRRAGLPIVEPLKTGSGPFINFAYNQLATRRTVELLYDQDRPRPKRGRGSRAGGTDTCPPGEDELGGVGLEDLPQAEGPSTRPPDPAIDELGAQVREMSGRMASMMDIVQTIPEWMNGMSNRMDGMNSRMDGLASRMDRLSDDVNALRGGAGARDGLVYTRRSTQGRDIPPA